MAKFIKTNPSGKIEICIRKHNNEKPSQDFISRKYPQSRYIKEFESEPWVKVVFSDGANFDYEWIRQELQKAASDNVLQIFNYRVTQDSAILFIKLTDISYSSFKSNCNKIPHPHSGQPCDVVVLNIETPETPSVLPEKWIASLKEALSHRYDNSTKSLNLGNFMDDRNLNREGLWMSLCRPAIVRAIVTLLQSIDNFSLNEVDMSQNGLSNTTHLIPLFEAIPIQRVNLSGNSLIAKSLFRTLQFANYLSALVIKNDGGMCAQKMKYRASFYQELMESCPSLEQFNHESIKSDICGVSCRLPVSRRIVSESDQILLNFFLEHAQKIETNRDELIDYYSSDSVLTLSACYHDMSMNNRRLSEVYLRNSRNLERLKDETKRTQLIKRGSAQILGLLSEIPKLKHIPESLTLDCIVNDDQSKMFVVNGLFVESIKITNRLKFDNTNDSLSGNGGSSSHNIFNVRMFSRAMIVIPPGKILQENWTITNPTDFIFRKYRDKFEAIRNSIDSEKAIVKTEEPIKDNTAIIVENFSQFSKMNNSYSRQCLQECEWNIDRAKEVFQLAFNNGKIPQEAFQN